MLDACSSGGTAYPFFAHNEQQRDTSLDPYEQLEQGAAACKTGTAEFGGQDSRGYRKTHGWFTLIIGVDQSEFGTANDTQIESESDAASIAAAEPIASDSPRTIIDATASEAELHAAWLAQLEKADFPQRLVITALVESDEAESYREGSRDAAPIAKALIEWMYSGSTSGVLEQARIVEYAGE